MPTDRFANHESQQKWSPNSVSTWIVVPCFNEADRLPVATFEAYRRLHPSIGFIFVDDGSTDETAAILEQLRTRLAPNASWLQMRENRGKAEAVRRGIQCAIELGAEYTGYWDADLATPLDAIEPMRQIAERRPELLAVLGCRFPMLGRDIQRKPLRRLQSRLFASAASRVLGTPVLDTQCGAKLLRVSRRVSELFGSPFLTRWIFDVEWLARLNVLAPTGVSLSKLVYEFPLDQWREVDGSKLTFRAAVKAATQLGTIAERFARGDGLLVTTPSPSARTRSGTVLPGLNDWSPSAALALRLVLLEGRVMPIERFENHSPVAPATECATNLNSRSATSQSAVPTRPKSWWREPMLGALVLLVLLIHVARVWDQPIRGEESRWAEGGIEMLRGGDWIVPTQQGTVFPERPPLNSWLMAIFSVALGEMSPLAVRLPSVLAVVGTAALIYGYLRRWLPASGAFLGGGVFATMGQVLQLGHLGESEAVLTALIGLSLLGWHDAWLDGRETRAWLIGFSAAGFAALTKGLQGPIYFVAVSGMFLLLQGWREPLRVLRTKGAWLGLASMALIIGAWAIPFWLRTDGATMRAIWTGLVADRVTLSGLAQHLGSYPLELLGCLLPWSLFLIPLAQRDVREVLGRYSPAVRFALLALAVTFPSVWLVTGARGRYYMPLYPVAAVGLALVAWSTWQGVRTSTTQRAWWRFVLVIGLISMGLGGVIGLGPIFSDAVLVPAAAPIGASLVGVICLLLGITLCGLVWLSRQRSGSEPVAEQRSNRRWVFASLLGVLLALGWIDGAFIVSRDLEHGDVVWSEVESLRQALPADTDLVSFGPVHHRFMYHWRDAIELRSWPESCDVIPPGDYFVIDYTPGDTPEKRASGRGRDWSFTSGTLPFRWELVRAIPLDREYQASGNWVLVGRVLRNDSGAVIATAQGVPSFESLTR